MSYFGAILRTTLAFERIAKIPRWKSGGAYKPRNLWWWSKQDVVNFWAAEIEAAKLAAVATGATPRRLQLRTVFVATGPPPSDCVDRFQLLLRIITHSRSYIS